MNIPRLKELYHKQAVPGLLDRFSMKNVHQAPKIQKIVVNMGVSEAKENAQVLDLAKAELAAITGQAPEVRRAKQAISNFKIRAGMAIGLRVTLRGNRMWEFLDRLISTAIPRIRDFRGLDRSGFDGQGNYNLGIREQVLFLEINTEKAAGKPRGMNITIVTSSQDDAQALELLEQVGMPFKKATAKTGRKEK